MTTQPAPTPIAAFVDAAETAAIERHKNHGHAEWPNICGLCLKEERQVAADREAERDAELDVLTITLVDQTGSAIIHVQQAQHAIAKLVSSAVYDIEFAEGPEGSDVIAGLAAAARELRNVERMAMRRREYLLEQDRHAADAAEARRLTELAERRQQQKDDGGDEERQPGDEGTCGHAVYPHDADRDDQCMRAPNHDGPHAPDLLA